MELEAAKWKPFSTLPKLIIAIDEFSKDTHMTRDDQLNILKEITCNVGLKEAYNWLRHRTHGTTTALEIIRPYVSQFIVNGERSQLGTNDQMVMTRKIALVCRLEEAVKYLEENGVK